MKNKKKSLPFVFDKSSSMMNCREITVNCFNSQLETIKELQKEFPEQELKFRLSFLIGISIIFIHINEVLKVLRKLCFLLRL